MNCVWKIAAVLVVGKVLLSCLKGLLMAALAMTVIVAAQMGLTGVLGFQVAGVIGKTAVTALFWYSVFRMIGARRRTAE